MFRKKRCAAKILVKKKRNWRDKDEQGDERSHLNTTQRKASKGASPPETREIKAMRVVLSDWLL